MLNWKFTRQCWFSAAMPRCYNRANNKPATADHGRGNGHRGYPARTYHHQPEICHGKPVIRGLRYPVQSVLEWLSAGMTFDEILANYAELEREDLMASLAFAARLIA